VDVSHDKELKRGLKTSGDKSDYNDNSKKFLSQQLKDSAQGLKDQMDSNRMGDKMNENVDRASRKMQQMGDETMQSMKDVGDRVQPGDLNKDMNNRTPVDPQTPNIKMSPSEESNTSSGMSTSQDREADSQHVQPGKKNLRGTEDNFDNDPGVSIGMMEDKIRETKNKITGEADQMMDSVKKTVKQTGQGIADTAKGMKDAVMDSVSGASSTMKGATRSVKEVLTGERDSEKPDETKSEVRTPEGRFPPGTKVKPKNGGVTVKGENPGM